LKPGKKKGSVAAAAAKQRITQRRKRVAQAVALGASQIEAAAAVGVSPATVTRDIRTEEGKSLLCKYAAMHAAKIEELYKASLDSLATDFQSKDRHGYARQDFIRLLESTDRAAGAGREQSTAPAGSFSVHDLLISVQQVVKTGE